MNTMLQRSRMVMIQRNLLASTQMCSVPSRPIWWEYVRVKGPVAKLMKFMNFAHTDRDDIITGQQFPKTAKEGKFTVTLEEGKSYMWCSCGHSKNQPFCDRSHVIEPTTYRPIYFEWDKPTQEANLCGCKMSMHPTGVMCDGSHKSVNFEDLEGTYKVGFNRHRRILPHQFDLIRETWPVIKGIDKTYGVQGVELFKRYLEKHPEAKELFYFVNTDEVDEKVFAHHTKKVWRHLEKYIQRLENREQIERMERLG